MSLFYLTTLCLLHSLNSLNIFLTQYKESLDIRNYNSNFTLFISSLSNIYLKDFLNLNATLWEHHCFFRSYNIHLNIVADILNSDCTESIKQHPNSRFTITGSNNSYMWINFIPLYK
jgi:hypothetical protein